MMTVSLGDGVDFGNLVTSETDSSGVTTTNTPGIPFILAQSAVPVMLVPNGTVATNGVITLGTALGTIFTGGAWIRLPADAVVGGAVGLYWAVFSSTTVGQVYENFYDPATQFIPRVPTGTLVAAVGSNAAYTQTTGAAVVLANIMVPANTIGADGSLIINAQFSYNTAAGNKLFVQILGGTTLVSNTRTTTGGHDSITNRLRNRGLVARQTYYLASESSSSSTNAFPFTKDTSTDLAYQFAANIDTATNWMGVEAFCIEVLPS